MLNDNEIGEGRAFGSVAEALMAFDRGELSVQAKIKLRLRDIVPPPGRELNANGTIMLETTLGRALFNEALPDDYPYADYEAEAAGPNRQRSCRALRQDRRRQLDQLKDIGCHWAPGPG